MTGTLEVLAVVVFLGLFVVMPAACSVLMLARGPQKAVRGPVRPYARAGDAGDYVRTGALAVGSLEGLEKRQFERAR